MSLIHDLECADYLLSSPLKQMAPGLPPPYSVAYSPGPGHPVSADRSGFETPSQFYGSAFRPPAPYGHATPTALNPIGRAGYQPWTYGHQSKMLPSFHNPGQNTYASHLKQFVSQPTHQNGHSYSQPGKPIATASHIWNTLTILLLSASRTISE